MRYIDSHCHYNDNAYKDDLEEVIQKSKDNGVDTFIVVGCDIQTSKEAIMLAMKYPFMYATIGIHPNETSKNKVEELEKLYNDYKDKTDKIIAIGEIGLDYHYDDTDEKMQHKSFAELIGLANKLKLPVVIHTREAEEDTIKVIESNKPIYGTLLHSFTGSENMVRFAIKNNMYFSYSGPITFTNARKLQEVIKMVPFDRMLVETDCPYLTPHPYRGRRNDSSYIPTIVQKMSYLKEIRAEELSEILYQNTKKFFNI